jgi:hypothetical protein
MINSLTHQLLIVDTLRKFSFLWEKILVSIYFSYNLSKIIQGVEGVQTRFSERENMHIASDILEKDTLPFLAFLNHYSK